MSRESYNPFDIGAPAPAEGGGTILSMPSATPLPDADPVPVTAQTAQHGRTLVALGLVYLRHGDAARAMVLGLAGMSMGDLRPATVLMVADAMLRAGDPRQSLTVLARFDAPAEQMSQTPSAAQVATRHYLEARALWRLEEPEDARAAFTRALEARPAPAPVQPDHAEVSE